MDTFKKCFISSYIEIIVFTIMNKVLGRLERSMRYKLKNLANIKGSFFNTIIIINV